MSRRAALLYLSLIGLLLAAVIAVYAFPFVRPEPPRSEFDGQRALEDVYTQVSFGPRTPESPGHARVQEWIQSELGAAGWSAELQAGEVAGHPIENIIATLNDLPPAIILGAHYDTRLLADQDPDPAKRVEPVPGANDGASGVAVLLELARTLTDDTMPVWLVFFDAEDNGRIEGRDWIMGSRLFVEQYAGSPTAAVIVDMIGDADLNIYLEKNSDAALRAEIWSTAAGLGYGEVFIPEVKYSMLDDHTPFLEAGLPAVDIIDFDYAYWHTTADTPDKVSAESLQAVGETLRTWIMTQYAAGR